MNANPSKGGSAQSRVMSTTYLLGMKRSLYRFEAAEEEAKAEAAPNDPIDASERERECLERLRAGEGGEEGEGVNINVFIIIIIIVIIIIATTTHTHTQNMQFTAWGCLLPH